MSRHSTIFTHYVNFLHYFDIVNGKWICKAQNLDQYYGF